MPVLRTPLGSLLHIWPKRIAQDAPWLDGKWKGLPLSVVGLELAYYLRKESHMIGAYATEYLTQISGEWPNARTLLPLPLPVLPAEGNFL